MALLFLCSILADAGSARAQLVDNSGSEFFIAFMPNAVGDDTDISIELHLTADVATNVTVQYPAINPTLEQIVAVNPGQITIVELGDGPAYNWTAGAVDSNSVRAFSDDDFVAYAINRQDASTDVAVALPIDALGTSYIVQAYTQHYEHSTFTVTAVHDSTIVTITPTRDMLGGYSAGLPFDVAVHRGEAFLGQSLGDSVTTDGDLTGTLIESNRPVQVSNGHTCAPVPSPFGSCDHLFEIAQPVPGWGTGGLAVPVPDRPGGSFYRVLASADNTTVQRNDTTIATLARGEFLETQQHAGAQVFSADKPILVTQFITTIFNTSGDPSMVTVLPTDQYLLDYTFSTVGDQQFTDDYVSIIAQDADVSDGTVLLDGSPVSGTEFTSIAGTGHSWAVLSVADGTHSTSSNSPHGITVMGYDPFDTYLYFGGTQYNNPVPTNVVGKPEQRFTLGSNYPNPFSSSTRIVFTLDVASGVSLKVYDLLGREVATLAQKTLTSGVHEVAWDGRDASGRVLPDGVYLYRLDVGGLAATRRMILVR